MRALRPGLFGLAISLAAVPALATPLGVDATRHWAERTLQLSAGQATASIELPATEAPFPFTGALPSWNGHSPVDGGFRVAMRFLPQQGEWTDWLEVGDWGGGAPARTLHATSSGPVRVDVDVVRSDVPLKSYAWRLELRAGATASPMVRRLSVCLTGPADTLEAQAYRLAHPAPLDEPGALEIPAPFRGQVTPVSALTGRICSPCTVASALGAYGIEVPTEVVAKELYDPRHDLFGVWPRAIMGASQRGVEGYVSRIRDYGTLRAHFKAGRVVGASIRFKAGTLQRPPYPSTNGHLILLRGFTARGDVITSDSYRAADGDGKVWDRADLAKAWFETGGVAYVFEGRPAGEPRNRASQPGGSNSSEAEFTQ